MAWNSTPEGGALVTSWNYFLQSYNNDVPDAIASIAYYGSHRLF